ncbi:MAG: oligosaccharide flippase family protein [Ignavibacteriaceae bacterium]
MKVNKNSQNIIYLFSLEFFVRLIGFAATTYLARVLGASNYGLINLGLAILGYALLFGNSGLTLLGTRKIAANSGNYGNLVSELLSARLFLSVIILVISYLLISVFITSADTKNIVLIYMLYLIPFAFLLEWFFQGIQRMGAITIGRIMGMSSYLVFLIIFVNSEKDTLLTAVGWILGGVVNSIILWLVFNKSGNKAKIKFSNFNFIPVVRESISLSLASIIAGLAVSFPVIYLGIVTTNTNIGIYSAAFKIIILFLTFDRVFNALFFPKIINCISNYPEKLEEIFNSILKIVVAFSLTIGLIEIVGGKFIITLVFGKLFIDSVIIFQLLTGYFTFTLINSVFSFTIIGMNKENIYTIALSIGAVIFVASSIVLYDYLSVPGVALALAFFEISVLLYMAIKLKQHIKIKILRNLFTPIAGTYIIILPVLLFIKISLLIKLFIILIICFPLILILTGFSAEEIKFIKRVLL